MMLNMTRSPRRTPGDTGGVAGDKLLTAAQLAKSLSVPPKRVYRLVAQGLPVLRLGARQLRFDLSAVLDWLRRPSRARGTGLRETEGKTR